MEHCLSFKEKTSVPSNTGLVIFFLYYYLTYYYSYHMYGWLADWLD